MTLLPVRKGLGAWALVSVAGVALGLIAMSAPVHTQTAQPSTSVTFAKDVAPILQEHCVVCHRPGEAAPMSLQTFDDVRPWARSMKQKVQNREMPPWYIDRTIGIQEYSNDPSLTQKDIDTIAKWVDAGGPQGNPADMPKQRLFASTADWTLGKPDMVIKEDKEFVIPAQGADQFVTNVVDSGMTEDRYIKAIEAKPTPTGRRAVHHMIANAIQDPIPGYKADLSLGDVANNPGRDNTMYLIEFVPGTTPDVFPEGTGRLLKAGAKISFGTHYHSVGEEIRDSVQIGIWFYPKGYVPKYQIETARVRPLPGEDNNYLDIPPGQPNVRFDGYYRLEKPAEVISFEPHMHYRGTAMSMEALLPNGHTVQMTSVPRFDWAWQIEYSYKNPPAFPAGTILHTISYYDNSASNKRNPDPTAWVGFGQRTIDEMANGWTDFIYIDEADFQKAVAAGHAPGTSPAMSNNQ
jgi:hypothetical protein